MTTEETYEALMSAIEVAMAGGKPEDTFTAYGVDYEGVVQWTIAYLDIEAERLAETVILSGPAMAVAAQLVKGIAIGMQLERTRSNVVK